MKALRRDAVILAAAAALLAACVTGQSTVDSSSTGAMSSSGMSSTGGFNISLVNTTANEIIPKPRPNVTTLYCHTTDQGDMRQWDNTTICIVVGGVAKILFYVNVDEFSLMQIVVPLGVNTTGVFDNQQMWFQAEYSQMASPMKYRQPQVPPTSDVYGYIVPYWTLIVTLKDGVVDTMEWDDGCYGCSGDQCVEETCSVSIADVGCRNPGSTADCNPKFFIGWYGTDRDGVYLTSAGSRSSRFRQYSLSSAVSSAYQTASIDIQPVQDAKFTPSCTSDPSACET